MIYVSKQYFNILYHLTPGLVAPSIRPSSLLTPQSVVLTDRFTAWPSRPILATFVNNRFAHKLTNIHVNFIFLIYHLFTKILFCYLAAALPTP